MTTKHLMLDVIKVLLFNNLCQFVLIRDREVWNFHKFQESHLNSLFNQAVFLPGEEVSMSTGTLSCADQ